MRYITFAIFLCYLSPLFSQEKLNVIVWDGATGSNVLTFQVNDTIFDITNLKNDSFNLKTPRGYIVYLGYSPNTSRIFSYIGQNSDINSFLQSFLQNNVTNVNYFDTICSNHQKNDSLEDGKWYLIRIGKDKTLIVDGIKTIKNNLWDGYFMRTYINTSKKEVEAEYKNGFLVWSKKYDKEENRLTNQFVFFDSCSLTKESYYYHENGLIKIYNNTIIGLSLHFDDKGTPIQIDEINKFEQGDGSYYGLKKLGKVNDKKYLKYLHKKVRNKPE